MKTKIIFISLICNLLICNFELFAGWELLQNSPTTNDLHSVFFIDDNTGWIAGYNNTIYKTTNSGESWVQQTSPESSNFQCITFLNANTGWACGSGGTVIKTTNGGASWFSQTFTGVKFNSLDFIDANTGYICGDNGIIWKTSNGGSNWVNQPSGIAQTLHQIKFLNSTTGFAVGDNAYILKTTNGGNSWDIKSGPEILSRIFYSLDFGVGIVTTGTLTKYSTNGGENWLLRDFPVEPINSITNLNESYIYSGVGANGYVVKTHYFDTNWAIETSPTSQTLYSGCYHDSSNYIWAVGAGGTILKNIPNWKYLNNGGVFPTFYDLNFINQNTGWVVGNSGKILKTTNSGTNWIDQTFEISYLLSVCFVDANTGFTVGYNGTILKTTNGGTNWITQTSGITPTLRSVYFTDANTGYTVGDSAKILKTTNGGTSWIAQTSGTTNFLYSVYFTNANTGYAVGSGCIILKTTNGGSNWITQNPNLNFLLSSVYFLDANTGFTVGDGGTILKTTNGGTNWITQTSGTTLFLYSVYFIDANLGYVCSPNHIYKTNNGGINWFEDELPPISELGCMQYEFVVENSTAVGFTVGDEILRTSFEYLGGDPPGNSGNYPGWVPVNSGIKCYHMGVDYINPFVAFAVGMERTLSAVRYYFKDY